MDARDSFTRRPTPTAALRPAAFGAEMFRRQELAEELQRGREAIAQLGPRVEYLYAGATAAGGTIPGVSGFDPVPPPFPGGKALVWSIAARLSSHPPLMRAVQVAVFRFEDYRRALDAATRAVAAPPEGLLEDLRRRAYLAFGLAEAFQDEPTLAQLFPPPQKAVPAPPAPPAAPPEDLALNRARALLARIGGCLDGINQVLALIAAPSAPRIGELLSAEARGRRALAVRIAATPASLETLRGVRAGHDVLGRAIAAYQPGQSLAAPCEKLAKLAWQGRRDPLLSALLAAAA
ncbi:MAG: hypothetical protein JWM80_1949 [Cyanobacteria bacterium RYN_339]|nr:hypothetical protein [Cyanobacteria bacterium RYN_339]